MTATDAPRPQEGRGAAPRVRACHRQATEGTVALALGGLTIPGKAGWEAVVEEGPFTYYLSRLDGEGRWVIDGKWAGARAVFHNGWGSRSTRLTYATVAIEAKLRARVAELEVEG
jgi:hypothetical protein